jgi:hypothetical protein
VDDSWAMLDLWGKKLRGYSSGLNVDVPAHT